MGAYTRRREPPAELQQDLDRVYGLFPRLRERAGQKGGTLSGGEQQMLAMARALMARPRLLLMDEPSMGLAPALVDQVFDIIQAINRQGTTILVVEQNATVALGIAHRGYVLQNGRIVVTDTAEALLRADHIRRAYLGEGGDGRPSPGRPRRHERSGRPPVALRGPEGRASRERHPPDPAAADRLRARPGHRLRAHRPRLHDGVRHPVHDQFRPRRDLHARRVPRLVGAGPPPQGARSAGSIRSGSSR